MRSAPGITGSSVRPPIPARTRSRRAAHNASPVSAKRIAPALQSRISRSRKPYPSARASAAISAISGGSAVSRWIAISCGICRRSSKWRRSLYWRLPRRLGERGRRGVIGDTPAGGGKVEGEQANRRQQEGGGDADEARDAAPGGAAQRHHAVEHDHEDREAARPDLGGQRDLGRDVHRRDDRYPGDAGGEQDRDRTPQRLAQRQRG